MIKQQMKNEGRKKNEKLLQIYYELCRKNTLKKSRKTKKKLKYLMRQKRNIINKNSKYITYTQFFLDYNFKVCSIFIFQIVSMSHYLNGTPPQIYI